MPALCGNDNGAFLNVFCQSVLLNPLPPKLAKAAEITRDEHYLTTTGIVHDQKHMGLAYGNQDPLYKKAPAHWKVDYNKDLHEKVVNLCSIFCAHLQCSVSIKLDNDINWQWIYVLECV